jgi:hypothetical protein
MNTDAMIYRPVPAAMGLKQNAGREVAPDTSPDRQALPPLVPAAVGVKQNVGRED